MSPSIGDLSTPASPSQRVTDPTLDCHFFGGPGGAAMLWPAWIVSLCPLSIEKEMQ